VPIDVSGEDISRVLTEYGEIFNLTCLKKWETREVGPKARVIFTKEKVARRVIMLANVGEIKVGNTALKMRLKTDGPLTRQEREDLAQNNDDDSSLVGSTCSIVERDIIEISKRPEMMAQAKNLNYMLNVDKRSMTRGSTHCTSLHLDQHSNFLFEHQKEPNRFLSIDSFNGGFDMTGFNTKPTKKPFNLKLNTQQYAYNSSKKIYKKTPSTKNNSPFEFNNSPLEFKKRPRGGSHHQSKFFPFAKVTCPQTAYKRFIEEF